MRRSSLFAAVNPWVDHHEIPFLGSRFYDSALFGVAGFLCVFVIVRLIQGKLWAWWIAFAVASDHWIGSTSLRLRTPPSRRFRAIRKWIWTRHRFHLDDTRGDSQCLARFATGTANVPLEKKLLSEN